MKSFIETQKALLTEIQNGCKRNFVLAREKEEKEQMLQQSASMPEITITEPLEEGAVEVGQNSDVVLTPEEGEEVGEVLVSQENGTADKQVVDGNNESSDSDTDTEEEEEKLEMKAPLQLPSSPAHVDRLPKPCGSPEKPKETLSVESQPHLLNPTEELKCEPQGGVACGTPPPQVSSPGNERRIAVSSPGRGHKIFVVTRVESLPEAAEEKDTRQDSPLQPVPPLPAGSTAHVQLAKTDCSGAQASIPTSPPGLEPSPSVPSCGAGKEKMNSGLCESAGHGVALPNGLKVEFAHALPDMSLGRDGKLSSCSVEHGKGLEEFFRTGERERERNVPSNIITLELHT